MVYVACVDQCCIEIGLWIESGLMSCLMSLRARLPGPLLVTRPEHPSVSLLCKGRVADGCLVVVVYLCSYGDGAMRAPRRFFCLSS